jgi:alpha-D-xyloside xylohydrolase
VDGSSGGAAIEPWGANSLRVRSKVGGTILEELPGALLDPPERPAHPEAARSAEVKIAEGGATVVNGAITASVSATGRIVFKRTEDGAELLSEQDAHFWWPGPRLRTAHGNGYARLEQRFAAYPDEKLYGLGQHQHGCTTRRARWSSSSSATPRSPSRSWSPRAATASCGTTRRSAASNSR